MLSERNMNKEIIFNFIKRNTLQIIISAGFLIAAILVIVPLFSAESVYVGLDQVAIRNSPNHG